MTTRAHLIKDVTEHMKRIWGPEGLKGESNEYLWLQTFCGITEGDDVRWQIIVEHEEGDNLGDWDDDNCKFVADDEAVVRFLENLLQKYKSSPSAFPRQYPIGSLEHTRSRLNENCFKHDCALIDAYSLADEGPRVVLGFDAFLRAIAAEGPAAVYWTESLFDIDDFIECELQAMGWEPADEDEEERARFGPDEIKDSLAKSIKRMQPNVGKIYEISAMFVGRGPNCSTDTIRADWADELGTQIRDLVEKQDSDVQTAMMACEAEDAVLMKSLVTELVINDVFRKTKGLNKRLLLAAKLLGDRVPQNPHGGVSRIAQNGDLCDVNLISVVKAADEQVFIEQSLPDRM